MASITIRSLDPTIRKRLRVRATENGRSPEEEARVILEAALGGKTSMSGMGMFAQVQSKLAPFNPSRPEPDAE
jgi:plasmid stability protein